MTRAVFSPLRSGDTMVFLVPDSTPPSSSSSEPVAGASSETGKSRREKSASASSDVAPGTSGAGTGRGGGKKTKGRRGGHSRGRVSRRAANHVQAEQDALCDGTNDGERGRDAAPSIPAHALVPQGDPVLIDRQEDLDAVIAAVRAAGCFAFDTEFIGEESYDAQICLVQIATPDRVWLIDPIAGVDPDPVYELIVDPSICTLVHAGVQDLEPVARKLGRPPAAIVDTQIIAGFCGLPFPLSLRDLVEQFVGVRLGKAYTFTRWDVRPLARNHRGYAADDVRYLHAIDAALNDVIKGTPAERWARAACAEFEELDRYVFDADARVRKISGGRTLSGRSMAALHAFVRLRQEIARVQDLPPRTVMRDEVLLRVARDLPRSEAQCAAIKGMPRPLVQKWGDRMLAIVEHVSTLAPSELPVPEVPDETVTDRARVDALYAFLQVWCHGHGIDPSLVASRRDVMVWYFRFQSGADLGMEGWRRECIGAPMEAFLRGNASVDLRVDHRRIRARLVEQMSDASRLPPE